MRRISLSTLAIALICAAAVAAVNRGSRHTGAIDGLENAALVERQTIQERLAFAPGSGAHRVDIDNYDGPVRVIAEDRDDVALVVHETVSAESRELLAQARRDVTLRRVADGPTVRVTVCGPWCDEQGRNCSFHGWERAGYRVQYEIEAHVPRQVTLLARTVQNGDVRVEGVRGDLRIENVNGSVSARGVSGKGIFGTVNGDLEVLFAANPDGPSRFSNVNGDIDVELRPGLAADVRLKTLNGEMWSDFPYTTLPLAGEVDRRNGRFVYANNHTAALRIAGGGPELSFETINGEIRLRRKDH